MKNLTNIKIWGVISIFLLLAIFSPRVCMAYSGGDGSIGNPYRIDSASDMQAIGADPCDWDEHFLMTADINLAGYPGTSFNIIGNSGTYFTGVFDANDHTISNFTYISPGTSDIGLFRYVGAGGEIKDLDMVNVDVYAGTGDVVGSLVGLNGGTITNCQATGAVTGDVYVGGLVGWNDYSTVSNCYATASVSGGGTVGGLVGVNSGTVSNCYAGGNVTGTSNYFAVGGLVGINWWGTVSNCHATGNVRGCMDVGGLVGENRLGLVSNCYATGSVTGDLGDIDVDVGGLVGENTGPVSNCYATGAVTGYEDVGGLVGLNGGTVSNCYATGYVTGDVKVGGLVGWNFDADILALFWDTQTTDQANGVGENWGSGTVEVYDRTTAEMQTESTFTDYGWDFVSEEDNGTEDIWRMCVDGVEYPKLYFQFIVGDFLCPDGVNYVDFAFFGGRWLNDNCGAANDCDRTDMDFSDAVDIDDALILVEHWMEGL